MPVTERLYYSDSHLIEFEARVVDVTDRVSGWTAIVLDRTAFYPTGGGQPSDTGTLNGVRVVECIDDGDKGVLHVVQGAAPSRNDVVRGRVDWSRRLDHMQQHTGQHILSQALVTLFNAPTRSFRVSESVCEIDVELREPTTEKIERAVELANNVIWEDRAIAIRNVSAAEAAELPVYDRDLLMRELELFPEWFLARHLSLSPDADERAAIAAAFDWLCDEALAQPVVLVHRDYHSRNLLVRPADNPGIVDFQDAVRGPVTYDLVSLLKDCYVVWPRKRLLGWLDRYRAGAQAAGIDVGSDREEFLRWFDRMGLQRHLKVLGIFARLWLRDGKPGYLGDLPRVLDYTLDVTAVLPELAQFDRFLRRQVVPAFTAAARRGNHAR
jgi:aminoglycoside/choline kinase family phosphotransferase